MRGQFERREEFNNFFLLESKNKIILILRIFKARVKVKTEVLFC